VTAVVALLGSSTVATAAQAQPATTPATTPATPAATAATPSPTSYRHGAVPPLSAGPQARTLPASANNLTYGGGNGGVGVTTGAPQVYLVFWGSQWGTPSTNAQGNLTLSGDPQAMAPDLQAFLRGLGTSGETWSGVMTQYCEGVAFNAQDCPANSAHVGYPAGGALAGVWADTAVAAPASATGHQLAVEAVNAANHFGNGTQAANRNAQYFVVSPTGTTPDGWGSASGQFCAWHDHSADSTLIGGAANSPFVVAFTNLPYLTDAGAGCGMNFVNAGAAGTLDGVSIVGGHEYAETITDQFPNGGWLDSGGNENGDKCAWIKTGQGASQDIALATGSFAVQSTWANDSNTGSGGCLATHPIVSNSNDTAPAITSAAGVTFTAGAAGSFTVTATGTPVPAVTATGTLPTGVTFNTATRTLAGTAALATAGVYPITISATNGVGSGATQNFTLTVDRATLTYPTDGQAGVDSTRAFTWAPIPEAQGYLLAVVTAGGQVLANSGILATTVTSYNVPALPTGTLLYAALYSEINGGWSSYQLISFTAAPGLATFTSPVNAQTGVDPTKAITWATIPGAQAYLLVVSTVRFGSNLVNSGVLAPTQSSYAIATLPAGATLYATLFTEVNGTWSRYQSITFTTGAAKATFIHPVNGLGNVTTPGPITWSTLAGAQGYVLVVGTTLFGSNLVNSGVLAPSQSSYNLPALPHGTVVYATLLTLLNNTWVYQAIAFATA
jgi:hypothetical protein